MIRSSKSWQAVAVAAVAGLVLSACGTTDDGGDDASSSGGGGGGAACDLTLSFFGPQTGPAAGLGEPIINGAQLAIDQYNEDADCEVTYEQNDSQGSPDQAPSLATEMPSTPCCAASENQGSRAVPPGLSARIR